MDDNASLFPCTHRRNVNARVYCKACHSRTGFAREVTVWNCERHGLASLYPEYVLLKGQRPHPCNLCEERSVGDNPRLTVGMAHHQDFDGAYFTIQSARLHHPDLAGQMEFVVVDNNPGTPHGDALKDLFSNFIPEARYVPFGDAPGTSAPRNRVLDEARGEIAVCCDCHVLFFPGALSKLVQFFDAVRGGRLDDLWPGFTKRAREEFGRAPQAHDLFHGPLLMDDLRGYATHFKDSWGAGMWGQWAEDPRGADPNGAPFEIRMMGLGAFAAQPSTWLGFHPLQRHFGGEEGYVHELYRTHGRKVWCLPFFRWAHRFHRPHGRRYHAPAEAMARNYGVELPFVGIPLDRMRAHYLEQGWDPVKLDQVLGDAAAELEAWKKAGQPRVWSH